MKQTRRTRQLGEVLRNEIAQIMRRDLSDPALELVSVTEVEVAVDLKVARVFVSALGGADKGAEAVDHLERAKGKIRHALARKVNLRRTPDLEFRLDTTAEYAGRIETLLHQVKTTESENQTDGDEDDDE